MRNFGTIAVLLLTCTACSPFSPTTASPSGGLFLKPTCDGSPRISRTEEPDYPDWVQIGKVRYFLQGKAAPKTVLGPAMLRVRCTLIDSGTRTTYSPVSGDSTNLAIGTVVYSIQGLPTSEAVATSTSVGVEIWKPE